MRDKNKEETERYYFSEFLVARKLPSDKFFIENRKPPEPDILYSSPDEEKIAFELTSLCSPEMARAQAKSLRTGEALYVRTKDPSRKILQKKLSKKYVTEHPIELLCYNDGRLVSPDNYVIKIIQDFLNEKQFFYRRIWFLGRNKSVHLLYGIR